LGLGEVKRDLSLCHGTSHIPTMEAIPCAMAQALYHDGACTCCTCANLCQKVGLQGRGKFPQKCQKIAGCWESAVYGSRPPIASKSDSSPQERPDLDIMTSQPWSEAICPCTTSASAYLRFVTISLLEKTRQSTRSGCTGASCVRPRLTRNVV